MKKDKYFGMSPLIARWKLDNYIENWLSYKADKSELWKKIYVYYYRLFDSKYYYGGIKFLNEIIGTALPLDKGMKATTVMCDMIYCLHRFGISFQDYCIYDFVHNHSMEYRESFVSDKLRYHYCDILNSSNILPLMTNKFECYKSYQRFYKRNVIGCFSEEDMKPFEKFLSTHKAFIYKPLNEHSGNGIEIFKTSDIDSFEFFNTKIENGPFILEELIVQGEATAKIHPQSVNSCRMVTFLLNGNVHILGAAWRIGSGNSVKDNAGSGGMYASVNPQTGVVETDAVNYLGIHFDEHPDTAVKIKGYQLPDWSEAISLTQSLAKHIEGTTMISWDIAYSTNGWLMVEANDNGDWSIIQSNTKIGRKKDLYYLMDQYFVNKK